MVDTRRTTPRRGTRKRQAASEIVPDVYTEMIAEAVPSSPSVTSEGRTLKKRRVGNRPLGVANVAGAHLEEDTGVVQEEAITRPSQTAYADSEESEESDIGWEDVNVDAASGSENEPGDDFRTEDLDIVLRDADSSRSQAAKVKNKTLNAAERRQRIEIHKMHLLCLLAHVDHRHNWCSNEEVQAALRPLLTQRTISYLNPNPSFSQFQRSRSLTDGLEQASQLWKEKFQVVARGLRKGIWRAPSDLQDNLSMSDEYDPPLEKADFVKLASSRKGSRDVGSQLFCALLRSVGVQTRLVCSLQPLPLAFAATRDSTPQSSTRTSLRTNEFSSKDRGHAVVGGNTQSPNADAGAAAKSAREVSSPLVPKVARRLGQPSFSVGSGRPEAVQAPIGDATPVRKRFKESSYPVYWVEVFNAAVQKWIPVDPLTTKSIAKPSKLEPPASDPNNCMAYVVAFEDDGTARDVTTRYASAFNAKTRKLRVEATPAGDIWWKKTMRFYRRSSVLNRDQIEDSELAAYVAQEPMPRNIQDFKNHPIYALERHLKKNEVIHPKAEVGKVAVGKAGGSKGLESIFRRRDVQRLRSANGWYRLGRDIKPGEQPLKRSSARRKRARSEDQGEVSDSDHEGAGETGLYAEFQTVLYDAPPVINGRVPKNSYGNIDVYVASMVPKGGVHIPYKDAARAARLLGVDYADAVTGFEFKGRHGTAVMRGIVVAAEHQEGIEAVIKGFHDEAVQEEALRRSAESLRLWRRLLAALRIQERIGGYDIEGEKDKMVSEATVGATEMEDDEGGGFFPDRSEQAIAEPTAGRFDFGSIDDDETIGDGGGGGFFSASAEHVVEPTIGSENVSGGVDGEDVGDGGGFLIGEDDEEVLRQLDARDERRTSPSHSSSSRPAGHTTNQPAVVVAVPTESPPSQPHSLGESSTHHISSTVQIPLASTTTITTTNTPPPDHHHHHHQQSLEPLPLPLPLLPTGENHNDEDDDTSSSLLSHDPDDEDAEPEWLLDDDDDGEE